jgi:DNA mismatch repair ATPase MutS
MSAIKFTEAELEELRSVQQQVNDIIIKLGQLEMNRINLDVSKKDSESVYLNLLSVQKDLAKKLSEKYGNGIVDPTTGIFNPTQSENITENTNEKIIE